MPGPFPASRRTRLTLLGILIVGATLRFWAIGTGLPLRVGPDEPQVIGRAVTMMKTGSFNPHGFFDYGTLTMYLQTAVASARFLAGAQSRGWSSLDQVWNGDFFLWGRIFTAILSVLTVYIVYRAAARWGPAVAAIAAIMMAVQPHLVREAHYALTDTPMTFFVSLTLLVSLCATEQPRLRWFLLAGITAGLAAATKYPGALAIVMPLAALTALPDRSLRGRATAAAVVLGGAAVGGLAGAPYTLLDLPGFLNGFASLMQHYNKTAEPFEPGWLQYFKHARNSFAWIGARVVPTTAVPTLLVAGVGLLTVALQLRSYTSRARALTVLLFPVVFYWFVSNQSLVQARYLLPIWPAVSIGFAVGVVVVRDVLAGPRASPAFRLAVTGALTALLMLPAWQSIAWDRGQSVAHSAELTAQWILEHVRPKERIVVESDFIHLPPPPRLTSENSNRLINEPLAKYQDREVVYLVVCSNMTDKYFGGNEAQHPDEVEAYNALFRATEIVAAFAKPGDMTFTVRRFRR